MTILYGGGGGGGLVKMLCQENANILISRFYGYFISYMSLFVKTKTIQRSIGWGLETAKCWNMTWKLNAYLSCIMYYKGNLALLLVVHHFFAFIIYTMLWWGPRWYTDFDLSHHLLLSEIGVVVDNFLKILGKRVLLGICLGSLPSLWWIELAGQWVGPSSEAYML